MPSGQDKYKGLTKELNWYLETGKKSNNLERLYQSLLSIYFSYKCCSRKQEKNEGFFTDSAATV